jgi:acetate kinase
MKYILSINCGSSSIKGKLYELPPSQEEPLIDLANLSVSNIASKGEKIKIKIKWENDKGKDVEEEGEDGAEVECELEFLGGKPSTQAHDIDQSLVPQLLEQLTRSASIKKEDIKYVTHRVWVSSS